MGLEKPCYFLKREEPFCASAIPAQSLGGTYCVCPDIRDKEGRGENFELLRIVLRGGGRICQEMAERNTNLCWVRVQGAEAKSDRYLQTIDIGLD